MKKTKLLLSIVMMTVMMASCSLLSEFGGAVPTTDKAGHFTKDLAYEEGKTTTTFAKDGNYSEITLGWNGTAFVEESGNYERGTYTYDEKTKLLTLVVLKTGSFKQVNLPGVSERGYVIPIMEFVVTENPGFPLYSYVSTAVFFENYFQKSLDLKKEPDSVYKVFVKMTDKSWKSSIMNIYYDSVGKISTQQEFSSSIVVDAAKKTAILNNEIKFYENNGTELEIMNGSKSGFSGTFTINNGTQIVPNKTFGLQITAVSTPTYMWDQTTKGFATTPSSDSKEQTKDTVMYTETAETIVISDTVSLM